MRVLLLAAGEGTRLTPAGGDLPKPLVPLLGVSIGERCLRTFVEAGVAAFSIVLGHQAEMVRAHFEVIADRLGCDLRFVPARDWKRGNGASALSAREEMQGDSFLLAMVDHLFLDPGLIHRVLRAAPGPGELALAVDRDRDAVFDLEDLTKVAVQDGLVTGIGKDLAPWDAGDTGLFHCTAALFAALALAREKGRHSLSDGIRELTGQGRVRAIDVTGSAWIDIDTPGALRAAERMLRHRYR